MILRMNATHRAGERRGAILLIVLTLLALFAVVALSFALYAESEALAARIRREAMSVAANPDPLPAANGFLQQMLFTPASDIGPDTLSALRGHEMARLIYGGLPAAQVPYNGIGTFAESLTLPTATGTVVVNRQQVVNYMNQFVRDASGNPVAASQHIVDPEHTGYRNSTQFNTAINALPMPPTYVAKNAPYTYPDRNNMCVAVQDPTTGRIVLLSYHRPTLFRNSTQPVGQSDLHPANPNWTNDIGRYLILRPRPVDHTYNSLDGRGLVTDFPYPPLNPDGTITGDVQNIIGTDGVQRNDAVWLNANLPVINWRGRNIIPLVAATVLPLDGRVNVNTAGNTKGTSTNGFGPWEVSLSQVINAGDATNMLRSRTGSPAPSTPNARGTNLSTMPFLANASQTTQSYASVNWDGSTAASAMVMPTASYKSDPTYPAGFDSSTTGNTEDSQHPSLFNPFSWGSGGPPGQPKLFPHTDLRRAVTRYSGTQSDYNDPFFSVMPQSPPNSLNGYGLQNPSNINRALVTTISNSLNRPGLMPNYQSYTAGTLQLTGGQLSYPAAPTTTLTTGTGPTTAGLGDYPTTAAASNVPLQSAMASLGAIDLNRPLRDYRVNTTLPIADPLTNVAAMNAAPVAPYTALNSQIVGPILDRNRLARDILSRLVLATGASVTRINPTTGELDLTTVVVGSSQYNAIRHLAQVAVNIVDYIDNDDINTPFIWNPIVTTLLTSELTFDAGYNAHFATPTDVENRVVFGTEKPRLVLNEVYSEIANKPGNPNKNMVRFWVELLNPGNAEPVGSPLAGYDAITPGANPGCVSFQAGNSPYRILITKSGVVKGNVNRLTGTSGVADPTNVLGEVTLDPLASTSVDSSTATNGTAILAQRIEPNQGYQSTTIPAPAAGTANGIRVLGPQVTPSDPTKEYSPSDPTALTATGMEYEIDNKIDSGLDTAFFNSYSDHTVILRRLANPYMAANSQTNPYITVDYMTSVHSEDAIIKAKTEPIVNPLGNRTANPMNPATIDARESVGKVQPFAGAEGTQAVTPPTNRLRLANVTTGYPASHVVRPVIADPAGPNRPISSLFSHNAKPAALTANEWLVHLDRNLINATELLHVHNGKPCELQHRFVQINQTVAHQHVAPWVPGMLTTPVANPAPLHRALELLGTKPRTYDTPFGGRVAGKINLNMVWDHRVMEALLDANASNGFINTDVYNTTLPADTTTTLWGKLISTRTPSWDVNNVPQPNATIDEGGTDRPFKSFGTASFAPGGLLPGGSGIDDTILRNGGAGTPAIFGSATHPYQKAEMLRKMQNNITTTTDTYMVVMTVGYFEVRNPGTISPTNPVVLGREVFDEIPGDMRAKFCAVVDRSALGLNMSGNASGSYISETVASAAPVVPPPPMSVVLQIRAHGYVPHPKSPTELVLSYSSDGRTFYIAPTTASPSVLSDPATTTKIAIGTGATAQTATVGSIGYDINGNSTIDAGTEDFNPNTGIATLVVTGIAGPPPAGLMISNGTLGNPGAQPNFDVGNPNYQGVVPYFGRIYPR